jgi:hypothetical protein
MTQKFNESAQERVKRQATTDLELVFELGEANESMPGLDGTSLNLTH